MKTANERRLELIELHKDLNKGNQLIIERLERIHPDDVAYCSVCGEIYDKKHSGVVCSTSCFRDRYM